MRARANGVVIEVHADACVPAEAVAAAVALIGLIAENGVRPVRQAAVRIGVDEQWPGHRQHQIEAVLDTAGRQVRATALGATAREALDDLGRKLQHRLGYTREMLRA